MGQQPPTPVDWNRLARELGDGAEASRLLATLTTFRIGGPAGLVAPVTNAEQARRFLDFAHRHRLPWTCLGGGSNILGDDDGYAGLVMLVRDRGLRVDGDRVHVGAGWDFDALIAETLRQGLTGLEFASGIPGTLGGAVVGNAGCYGREIGEFVREATVLGPDGTVATVGPEAFGFAYRDSLLKGTGHVVLDVTLALARGDLATAGDERADHLADRRRKHPWDIPCAGSYFKNLPAPAPGERRRAAGILLEQVGAKAMHEGGAAVFEKHANIIVNRGGATCRDVLTLAARMKQAVRERFGEELDEEVRHLATPRATQDPAVD